MLSSFYGANRTTNLPTCFGCASVIYGKNALDSKKMKEMSGTPAVSNGNVGRIALATAALIATGAVSYALISRSTQPAPATPQTEVAQQDIGASITQLEAKLKANPNDANGWRMLGWSLFETGKFAESAQAYRRATQLSPDKGEYWSSLGEALTLAGGGNVPAIAKQAFDKAVALDPKDPRARYFLAVEKDIAGDHKGAIETYAVWWGKLQRKRASTSLAGSLPFARQHRKPGALLWPQPLFRAQPLQTCRPPLACPKVSRI
jgi:cytochrome c-type biogenesis protein CcmH/NrfG